MSFFISGRLCSADKLYKEGNSCPLLSRPWYQGCVSVVAESLKVQVSADVNDCRFIFYSVRVSLHGASCPGRDISVCWDDNKILHVKMSSRLAKTSSTWIIFRGPSFIYNFQWIFPAFGTNSRSFQRLFPAFGINSRSSQWLLTAFGTNSRSFQWLFLFGIDS